MLYCCVMGTIPAGNILGGGASPDADEVACFLLDPGDDDPARGEG